MEICVLGPLSMSHQGVSIIPTAPKPRSVLALLITQLNQTVRVPDLLQELWDDEPPTSALTTLQTYILQLRKRIAHALAVSPGTVAGSVLVTVPGGYQFRSSPEHYDLPRYQQLAADGKRALATGDNAGAAELLHKAQALWRGPALADVAAGRLLLPQVRRLQESRLTTMAHSIEARMRLGGHQEVLADLAGLTAEYPQDENLHALLMIALHRSGRRQEALRTFQHLRTMMVEAVGLEPSRRLHQLQQAILADDPKLDVAPPTDSRTHLLERIGVG